MMNCFYNIPNILIIIFILYIISLYNKKYILGIGDWGLGIGDWGLGIGPNPQSPYNYILIIIQTN